MDNLSGRTLHVAEQEEYVSTLDLVERDLRSHISLNKRLLTQQRELVDQMDGLGIDTSRFKTRLGGFEKKQCQHIVYVESLLNRGRGFPQRVALELQRIPFYDGEERLGQAAFAERGDAEITLARNDPEEPLKSSSEYALAPILDNLRLRRQAARRPRSLAKSNVEAVETSARFNAVPGGQAKKGSSPLVTEQGLRLNRAFLKIGSTLFREAVTALAEELATKKTVELHPKERLGLTNSFDRIKDSSLRRALIELTEAIVRVKSRC